MDNPVLKELMALVDGVDVPSIVLGTTAPTLSADSALGWLVVEYGDHVRWKANGTERSVPWEVASHLHIGEMTLAGAVSALYVLAL